MLEKVSVGFCPGVVRLVPELIIELEVPIAFAELVALRGIPVEELLALALALAVTWEVVVGLCLECDRVKDATIDEEIFETSVTGQTVVVMSTTLVTSIVDTASEGSVLRAAVSEAAGQFVIVAAHEMIVETEVTLTVNVV